MEETEKAKALRVIETWMRNEQEMSALSKELAKRRKMQKELTAELVEFMRENDLPESDIRYVQQSKKKSLSKKSLVPILLRFFKGNADQAAELSQFIFDNRETVVSETVKQCRPSSA